MAEIDLELTEAAKLGMRLAVHAKRQPDTQAIWSKFGSRTFSELNSGSNRLVRGLRGIGFEAGNGIALLSRNRPEFVETYQASLRSGGRMTPINWHLTPEEVSYIVCDSEAVVLIADAHFADSALRAAADSSHLKLKVSVGGEIEGFVPWDELVAKEDASDILDPQLGISMLYTSGTTGHPKGVTRQPTGTPSPLQLRLSETAAFNPKTDVSLVTGPLYHAAPLSLNLVWPLAAGLGCILMDRWDAEETLELIDRFSCTHTHMVATMFHRILKLPEGVRERYDLSSMRWILHGAAPTPVHVKAAIIEWLGPVVYEYYAATEGGSHFVTSDQWLKKPGSVGPICEGNESKIVDENGDEVAQGESGTVYFKAPEEGRFEYFKAPEKTRSAYLGDWFHHGRHGVPGRRRLPLPEWPKRGDHHLRWRQHLSPGDRRCHQPTPGDSRGLHDRGAERRVGRIRQVGDRAGRRLFREPRTGRRDSELV